MKYKVNIFAFCFLFFTFRLLAADTWVKTYRPFQEPYMEDKYFVEDVIVTQDSGYVVSGSFDLCDEFYSERWGFLMKTDKDGNMLWARKDSVDFLGENDNYACVETSEGDLITCGYQLTGGGYMIKRDSEGNRLWAIPYDDFGVNSMDRTVDDNMILGGRLYADIALRKIDNDGNTIWTNSIQIGTGSNAYSIYSASNGDYLLTGVNYTAQDIIVVKTDCNGDSLWTRTFDGLGGHDIGNCIIETNEGNIMVIGEIHTRAIDTFLGFYEPDGDVIWEYIIDDMAAGKSVLQANDGNFIAYSWGGVATQKTHLFKFNTTQNEIWNRQFDFYPSNGDRCFRELAGGSFICSGETHYNNNNFFLAKTDSSGQIFSIDDPVSPNNTISINIFPNPIREDCNISLNSKVSLKDPVVTIYNTKGQLIRELKIKNSKFQINEVIWDGKAFDGKEVQNGIYFLKLEGDNYRAVKKVTKIK